MYVRKCAAALFASVAMTLTMAVPSAAETVCPDGYNPVPSIVAPDADKNGNGIVCVKGPQGGNGHFNVKDDKGFTNTP